MLTDKDLTFTESGLTGYCLNLKDRLGLKLFKQGALDARRARAACPETQAYFFNECFGDVLKNIRKTNPEATFTSIDDVSKMYFMDEMSCDGHGNIQRVLMAAEDSKKRCGVQMDGDRQPFHMTCSVTSCSDGNLSEIPPFFIHSGGTFNEDTNTYDRVPDDYVILLDEKYKHLKINGYNSKNGSMEKGKW